MNKETYEALKRIVEDYKKIKPSAFFPEADIAQVESWIDEVAKEYTEEEVSDYHRNEIRQGRECLDDNLA